MRGWRAWRRRCEARSPAGRWSATTRTTSSRATSRCRSRCSTTSGRGSCSPASTTVTRLACTASRCAAAAANSSSRPRRPRPCAWRSRSRARARAADRSGMSTPPDATGGRPRVGYLGPAGTFSEEALLASVAENAVEAVAEPTIYDSVLALRRGEIRWAVVPIENSLEGSINVTLHVLAEEVGDVSIVGEILLGVHHCLIAVSATVALQELETVLTHPQVPGQC